jgi:Ni/Fe-hydrogenase subunit HybB-like protein
MIAKFSLVFSFALLMVAPLPLLLHLQQPLRCEEVFLTPHFTSAIASFGLLYSVYFAIVASEIWFIYRRYFVEQAAVLKDKPGFYYQLKRTTCHLLTLGAYDISQTAIKKDEKAVKLLASIGIPVACFLHGYAGFIFGSVKANALWMTPLMPVIFIVSAIVSGIALCMLTYSIITLWRSHRVKTRKHIEIEVIRKAAKYLLGFLVFAITLELLDLIFRGYTAMKSWDILRSVIFGKDIISIFVLQYVVGNMIPLILLLLPRLSLRRILVAISLVLFGVFMMRWNVVIGGQAFSLSFSGYMQYHLPIIPRNFETYKEGLFGALTIAVLPFIFFWALNKLVPSLEEDGFREQ